jgi:tetratricopeptide (TPR) repeat protein
MAQDRADLTPTPALPNDETGPGAVLSTRDIVEIDEVMDRPSMGSIDKLLAITDEDWDIDNQVQTLKNAAELKAPVRPSRPPAARPPPLRLPTPYEIGPTIAMASLAAGAVASAPSRRVPSVPPPLPGTSSRPPPRPKGPPPLPPFPGKQGSFLPAPQPPPKQAESTGTSLVELLTARAAALEATDDKVGLARAEMEMAIAAEVAGDDGRSTAHAEAALKIDPDLASAHSLLRRRKHSRASLPAMLGHLERELAAATAEAGRVELLVEKARLLDAIGERPEAVRAAWSQALAHAPHHAAALKGLEGELFLRASAPQAGPETIDALAAQLGHMADAYGSEPFLAAWLHIERAQLLEKKLGRIDAARGALERALELDPRVGPVRDAFVRHVASRGDAAALVKLLDDEALIETIGHRSARLELEAATVANLRLGDSARAAQLLDRAAARAPTTPSVDRRVLDDLIRLREMDGQWTEAARARRARLRFITDPPFLAHELRTLAMIAERLGDLDTAIGDAQRALGLDANDSTLVDMLDRLLAMAARDEQRVALWLTEAARTDEGTKRARALVRAAGITEQNLARPGDAIRHLRTAWTAAPGDSEVLDALARLLTPAPSERTDGEARALIDLYAQAADTAHDMARRVAYLEKIALIWEDLIGDARRASKVYEDILKVEPNRRGAVLGLARTAARIGDDRALARALIDEARLSDDGVDVLALKTRAATSMARVDPARALTLVNDVLSQEPAHVAARALATRLHEDAGRWEHAAQSMRDRIDHAPKAEKMALWLARAQLQETRLKSPLDALASLKAARALDPRHPVPPDAVARVLEAAADDSALRDAFEALAADAVTAEERARHLVRAAEIEELKVGDDVRAASLYTRALAETPDDEMIADRLVRVLGRRGSGASTSAAPPPPRASGPTRSSIPPPPRDPTSIRPPAANLNELATLLSKRIEQAPSTVAALALSFDLALLLIEVGLDIPRATSMLESLLVEVPDHVPALRTLEAVHRRNASWAPLARVLSAQADALRDVRGRMGALWALAALEEWRLPVTSPAETYLRILDLDPTDPGALEATVRRELPNARHGEPHARKVVVGALRSLCALAADDSSLLAIQLRLGLLLEQQASEASDAMSLAAAREALDRYREAMQIDPLSVTATTGLARLSARLNDTTGALTAALSLAELAVEPPVRARYLIDAADLLMGPDGAPSLGTPLERSDRAGQLLERALETEPDNIPAAERLAGLRLDRRQGERLVETFRTAMRLAKTSEAIIALGSEVARVARDDMRDLTIAIDAMRRVREAAPQHVPSLLTLSELCIAQRAWPEAVDALESVVSTSREAAPKLTALFALASIYEKVLSRPADAERVLRTALESDPASPRALRGLLRRLTAAPSLDQEPRPPDQAEIADLLGRLAEVERDPEQKGEILLQLAEIQVSLGDIGAAERALIEAVAHCPTNTKAFARLASLSRTPKGQDHVRYARSLNTLLGRGQQLGKVDARWLATLGQLEIESLNRLRDGIVHLQRAAQLDPSLYETRFELASAYAKASATEEAVRALFAMILPDSRPLLSISDPGQALALLERTLGTEHRAEEALVVSELRAIAGELDDGRHGWLRARRLGPLEPHHGQLDRTTLVTHVLPQEARHVMLEVAAAIAGVESKILRADLTELGISARDRVRSGHPTRALLDRVARTLGVTEVELVVATSVTRVRVLANDVPWVVVPRSLVDLPEPAQVAALARAVARIAYGVPWLEELPPPQVEGLLIAAARQVVPNYGKDEVDAFSTKIVAQYEPSVARVLTRKHKKLLEELAPHIGAPQGSPLPIEAFIQALTRAEMRAAYLVCGDLLATLDELRQHDPSLMQATERPGPRALAGVLEHPFAGDVCRYALSPEATALRRRIGSAWTG